jgi:hypothetical protein
MNLGIMATKQVPTVWPLRVIETPEDRVSAHAHHFLTTQTELWGFIKSSAPTLVVHMELSLRLQLSRSLRSYTMGTTAGLRVTTMKALAPESHLRIS